MAVDVDVLLSWEPTTARQAPSTVVMSGAMLQRASTDEALALPPPPPPARPRPRDRWADLEQVEVRPGYVVAQDFCMVFGLGVGNLKKGAERVLKRLRGDGCADHIHDWHKAGRPWKIARVSDLRRSYRG